MSRGVRGYQYKKGSDERVREGSYGTNRLIRDTMPLTARARARFLLPERAVAAMCTNTKTVVESNERSPTHRDGY